MTYAQDEASREDGDPVELYEFVGSVETFRYTNAEVDVVFDTGGGPETFFAIPIKRSEVAAGAEGDAPVLSVTLPIDTTLAERYVFQIAPQALFMTLFRLHQTSGFSSKFWEGEVFGWSVKERLVALRVPNQLVERFNDEIPTLKYQQLCNNVLYDGVCAVPSALFQVINVLGPLVGDQKTLTVSTMGGNPDGWAVGGLIASQATGESRLILSHVGLTLVILWPFSVNVSELDTMVVNAGCDHSLDDCFNKFSNEENFNGMPFILTQALNPTQGGD